MVFTNSIAHPNEFSVITGRTQLSKEVISINESIKCILLTAEGELFGDPNYGSMLYSYLYEFEGDALHQIIKQEIVRALTAHESRIYLSEDDITCEDDGLTVNINIAYNIRYTDYRSEYSLLIQRRKEEVM